VDGVTASAENGKRPLFADALLVLITGVWGLTFVTIHDALAHADAFSWLALRFAVGAAVAAAVARRRLLDRSTARGGAVLAVFLFTGFVLQTKGLALTTPSRSAFITGMSVVLVPGVSFVLFRRPPKVSSLVGVAFAAAGLYLLTGFGRTELSPAVLAGDLFTGGCAVAFAVHISLTERYASNHPAMALVAIQLALVSVASAACIPFVPHHVEWTPGFIAAFLFCGVVASALALGVQTWAQARTTAVRAALVFSLEPVFAAAYSVARGREVLGVRELWGGALIVFGIIVAEAGAVFVTRWRRAEAARF
jgi:drug/metabolite transporter (DMT)-like permease